VADVHRFDQPGLTVSPNGIGNTLAEDDNARLDDAIQRRFLELEVQRLTEQLHATEIELAQARTGRALLDLEREREDRLLTEDTYVKQISRLVLENRDLRAENERLRLRQVTTQVDVGHETAMEKLRDMHASLDRLDALLGKERNDQAQP
jgi:Xaa-Pro aminopeptidase